VIVVDENRRVVALISRADIIRWVYMNSERPEFRVRQIIFD
jgi:CBS domain-containing protein